MGFVLLERKCWILGDKNHQDLPKKCWILFLYLGERFFRLARMHRCGMEFNCRKFKLSICFLRNKFKSLDSNKLQPRIIKYLSSNYDLE